MALRLQSSLLYGVSRVFSQQCGYILTDTQSLSDKMRGVKMMIHDLEIDDSMAFASNEQLNFPNDPSFNFDLDIGLDLSVFDVSTETSDRSSLLSPHTYASTQSSLLSDELIEPEIELPSIHTQPDDIFVFNFETGTATSSIRRLQTYTRDESEEPGIDENPLFDITDDGVIVDRLTDQDTPVSVSRLRSLQNIENDPANVERVQLERAALANTQEAPDIDHDDGYMVMGDDGDLLPLLPQALVPIAAIIGEGTELSNLKSPSVVPPMSNTDAESTAEAPQRRGRSKKPIVVDFTTELNNRQLSEWQDQYLAHMTDMRFERMKRQNIAQAKRNAAFWVLDQGIGGAMVNFGEERETHPLSIFSGQNLLDALTGAQSSISGRKRSHSVMQNGVESEDGEIRKSPTASERSAGRDFRHQALEVYGDDDGMIFQGDDEVESQIGRQLASSLKDQPSAMPWNVLGSSRQGSVQSTAHHRISSSVRGFGIDIGPSSGFSGQRLRLTSASPLVGRGRPLSRLTSLEPQQVNRSSSIDTEDIIDPFAEMTGVTNDDFEIYGPAAAVSTQQAAQSQWLAATLENEAHNFLVFLNETITNTAQEADSEASITFDILLPPKENSNIVAAQGILHVLALATKGFIQVQQDEAFGDIFLSIVKQEDEMGGVEQEDQAMEDV